MTIPQNVEKEIKDNSPQEGEGNTNEDQQISEAGDDQTQVQEQVQENKDKGEKKTEIETQKQENNEVDKKLEEESPSINDTSDQQSKNQTEEDKGKPKN